VSTNSETGSNPKMRTEPFWH